MQELKVKLCDQVKSGKNHMIICRSGHRFPLKEWAEWRDSVVSILKSEIRSQFGPDWISSGIFAFEVSKYVPVNKARRDLPGMQDALFHCFEEAGVVDDDSMIKQVVWPYSGEVSKEFPFIEFVIRRIE